MDASQTEGKKETSCVYVLHVCVVYTVTSLVGASIMDVASPPSILPSLPPLVADGRNHAMGQRRERKKASSKLIFPTCLVAAGSIDFLF